METITKLSETQNLVEYLTIMDFDEYNKVYRYDNFQTNELIKSIKSNKSLMKFIKIKKDRQQRHEFEFNGYTIMLKTDSNRRIHITEYKCMVTLYFYDGGNYFRPKFTITLNHNKIDDKFLEYFVLQLLNDPTNDNKFAINVLQNLSLYDSGDIGGGPNFINNKIHETFNKF